MIHMIIEMDICMNSCWAYHRYICIQIETFWASLVAQLVKNPPAMLETWVQSLSWEDPLEKGRATHSSILAWKIPWTVQGVAKSQT